MTWFRNSYGVIVNGIGWEIAKDATPTCEACGEDRDEWSEARACGCTKSGQHVWTDPDCDPARPWSLWHHGECVGNYETVESAKVDVDTSDCSKCRDLA